ncbi:MAG: universal stress protein [Desulfobacteraceae bacterium]|nr:MAG: universal stress protein [Desulfobacteraceae bacterium]
MGLNMLVAFDDSDNAMRAIEFIVKTFNPESRVTLFYVIQDSIALCDMNSPELTPYFLTQQSAFCALEEKKKELVNEAMQKAKGMLTGAGFKEKNIETKIEKKQNGVARDIINEAHSGYDLVVIGRRGLSGIMEFILGSVSQKVLQSAKDISVLIVN